MGTLHSGTCEQCGRSYCGYGLRFCGCSCRVTWTNLHRNVAKRPEVREKISQYARRTNRQKQLMTPLARRKALIGISRALRGRHLTPEHRAAIGRASKRAGCRPPRNPHLIGPAHPGWRGGVGPARTADFHSLQYKTFHSGVLRRDNWTCQRCGKRGGVLRAHHIKSWAEYPALRHDITNGLTLCRQCHYSEHRGQARPKGVGPRTVAELRSGLFATS